MPVTNVKTKWVSGNLVFYDKSGNIIATWDGTNRKVSFPAGSTLEVLGTAIVVDAAFEAPDMALANGKILIGDAAGKAAAKTPTGDVTVTNEGVTAIGAGKVTSTMLANGAGAAALLTTGLGGSHSVLKAEAAVHTVVALNAAKARACIVLVTIDETYAAVGGVAPTIKVGETDDDNACFDVGVITNQAAGTVLAFAFTNTANKAIIITTTAATVDATGGCSVTVLAIPTT